jgi:hypothetical protein
MCFFMLAEIAAIDGCHFHGITDYFSGINNSTGLPLETFFSHPAMVSLLAEPVGFLLQWADRRGADLRVDMVRFYPVVNSSLGKEVLLDAGYSAGYFTGTAETPDRFLVVESKDMHHISDIIVRFLILGLGYLILAYDAE